MTNSSSEARHANAADGKNPYRCPAPNLEDPSTRADTVNRYLSAIPQRTREKYERSDEWGAGVDTLRNVCAALRPLTPSASVENVIADPAIWAVDERCMVVPPTTSRVCSSPKRCWYWSVFSKLQLKVSDSPRLPSPPLLSPGRTVEGE